MGRTILDIMFSIVMLMAVCIHYFCIGDMTPGVFYLLLMANYMGTRYLLMSNLDLALIKSEINSMIEDENE